ncbi:hypothetical protein NC99_40180 [Sunxiuqinia dokdonensis]|uniref:Uncharacterized protein n=1 Tax=Sunxiuqinia dokdonensis TaxID=1409788 RepID=A0A0L8V451_9BACT|nr:hypothetical protein NC99_40180 [Sunxiuqinia dokdonensis]
MDFGFWNLEFEVIGYILDALAGKRLQAHRTPQITASFRSVSGRTGICRRIERTAIGETNSFNK